MDGAWVDSLAGPFRSSLMDIQLLQCDADRRDQMGNVQFVDPMGFSLSELDVVPAMGAAVEDSSALISLEGSVAMELCNPDNPIQRAESVDRTDRRLNVMNSGQKSGSAFGFEASPMSCFLNSNDDSSSRQPDNCGRAREPRAKKQSCRSSRPSDRSKLTQRVPSRTQSQRHNHILAERQRREEMNEKFSILRAILPKLTKKDKASIVTDTINYVRELEKMVRHLQACKSSGTKRHRITSNKISFSDGDAEAIGPATFMEKYDTKGSKIRPPHVEVQDLGSRAVIKVICCRSRGLVLRTHKALDECKVDVLQSNVTTLGSSAVHYFTVQMNPGVSASRDELINALQQATA